MTEAVKKKLVIARSTLGKQLKQGSPTLGLMALNDLFLYDVIEMLMKAVEELEK